MAALLLFTGLGGGSGGCLVPWAVMQVGARGDCWADAPTEDTDRTALDAAAEVAEGEAYWDTGWLEGVRGWVLTGSVVEVMSHFGGIRDCLSGRGSCRASRRASGSKWMSDSVKTRYRNWNVLESGPAQQSFSAASPLKVEALVWGEHYLGIICVDKQRRKQQLPPKAHLSVARREPLLLPHHFKAPALKLGLFIHRQVLMGMSSHSQRGNKAEEKEEVSMENRERERRTELIQLIERRQKINSS